MKYAGKFHFISGVSWCDMHSLSYRVMLGELTKFGLLKGDIDEMIKVWYMEIAL